MQFVTLPTLGRVQADIFQQGLDSARPASNGMGGEYFSTDTGILWYDAGPPIGWVPFGGGLYLPGLTSLTLVSGANGDITIGNGSGNIAFTGPGAPYSISGIVPPISAQFGQIIVINNFTSVALTILDHAGAAGNGFICPYGIDLVVPPFSRVIARYASSVGLWLIIATTPVGPYNSLVASSTAISNTVAETAFSKTLSVQANILNFVGAMFRWSVYGTYSRTTSTSITIRLKIAGNAFHVSTLPITANRTNIGWSAQGSLLVRSSGAGGTGIQHCGLAGMGLETAASNSQQPVAFAMNWTIANTATVTAQWQAANAGDTITLDGWAAECLLPSGVTS